MSNSSLSRSLLVREGTQEVLELTLKQLSSESADWVVQNRRSYSIRVQKKNVHEVRHCIAYENEENTGRGARSGQAGTGISIFRVSTPRPAREKRSATSDSEPMWDSAASGSTSAVTCMVNIYFVCTFIQIFKDWVLSDSWNGYKICFLSIIGQDHWYNFKFYI